MDCIAKTPGASGYRGSKGQPPCHCPVCRAGHAAKQRAYRAAKAERERLARLEEQAQADAIAAATPPAPDTSQAAGMLDASLPPGAIEKALNEDLARLVGEPPWKATLSALARANARIVDQIYRHQRLDVLSGVQLRMVDILDRLRRTAETGGGVPADLAGLLGQPDDGGAAR